MASKNPKRRSVGGTSALVKSRQPSSCETPPAVAAANDQFAVGPVLLEQDRLEELLEKSLECVADTFAEVLSLNDRLCSMKEASILDCYVTAFAFCLEEKFPLWLTSAFLTTFKLLLNKMSDQSVPESKLLEVFRSAIAELVSFASFRQENAHQFEVSLKKIVDYFHRTVFQHYHLFRLLFSDETRESETIACSLQVTNPHPKEAPRLLFPPPLDESLEEKLWVLTQPKEEDGEDGQKTEAEQEDEVPIDSERLEALLVQFSTERIQKLAKIATDELLEPYRASVEQKIDEKQKNYLGKISALNPKV